MNCSVFTSDICALHDDPSHPETQERLFWALSGVPQSVQRKEPDKASIRDLRLVHLPEYIEYIHTFCSDCTEEKIRYLDPDTYASAYSYMVSRMAAGAAIAAMEHSIDGSHALSLMRPPGHHAMPGRAMGFCIFNNIAVAAASALFHADRVAIVDWDVHHGNGTQYMFYHSDRVLYCSVHELGNFPGTGHLWETGSGAGKGYTVNAPLEPGSTIADYGLVFSEVFAPRIEQYHPEVVLVSAGMDVLYDDILGHMLLLPADIGILTGMLLDSTDIPLAFVLEGGYSPGMKDAMTAIIDSLGGNRIAWDGASAKQSTRKIISILNK